jgi:isoaspartyl peptidase/L-asparaginase-like protein (Ntn-hydrolase superfamily)
MTRWVIAATWPFGQKAVNLGSRLLAQGMGGIDVVEQAIEAVELDLSVDSVGVGGIPNCEGEVQLDAALMRGKDLAVGAVAGVKGFPNPISIARLVLEKSPHHLLVGEGAERYADAHGLKRGLLLTAGSLETWRKRQEKLPQAQGGSLGGGHDTVGVVALDMDGDITAGTSTSGLALKLPGRVGDSPLVGSGFYADNSAGAAVATGCGELIMRGCLSFVIVELIRGGATPQQACEEALSRLVHRLEAYLPVRNATEDMTKMAVLAIDREGAVGAAANHGEFDFAYQVDGDKELRLARAKTIA